MRVSRLALGSAIAAMLCSGVAVAATQSSKLHSEFALSFDCERPQQVRNYSARANFEGVLNGDGTASGDLTINGFALASTIHFDARLGRGSQAAPGGSSQLRVLGAHALRGIWSLPNNDLIVNLTTSGSSCAVAVKFALKRGQKEYSLWGGNKFYYCSAARVLQASCRAE